MSRQFLNNYYNKLDETIRFGGSRNETTVEHAFIQLVDSIAERHRFADYKETVIDLLKRVCTVSVKTVEITNQMPEETQDP